MKRFQSPQNARSAEAVAVERKVAEDIQRYGICSIVLNNPERTEMRIMGADRTDSQFCWDVALAIKGFANRKLRLLQQNRK